MSQTKVKSGLLNFPDQTDFVKLPSGTTAQRPSSPEKGYSRYNTTDNKLEFWTGTIWQQLPGVVAPIITSISYPGDDLAADPAGGQTITINGSDFKAGATVTVDGTTPSVITFVSATEITFTAPAKVAGDYDIVVTNVDGGNATAVDGMTYNGLPSWTTPAGNLGTFEENTTIPTITLVAAEPDSGAISYSITTGGLPTGLSLTGADIDGTTPAVAGETTYNFTVTATDNENQSTERAFNIVVYKFVPYFNTVLYTGQSVPYAVEVGFKPDLIWAKSRTNPFLHGLFDTLRPNGRFLSSNLTDAESSPTNTAFHTLTDTGFIWTESSAGFNASGDYVAWCWKAGGAAVTNPQGNTASQISANPDAGFSIITHTSSMQSSQTFGHGLNSTPKIVISRVRNIADSWWVFMPDVIGNTNVLELNDYAAARSVGLTFNANDTTFNIQWTSASYDFLHYCFAEVAGFSKFGSYVGGTANNPITLDFEPAFVMIKSHNGVAENWAMYDNKRSTSNPVNDILVANESFAESVDNVNQVINFDANGFTLVTTNSATNLSGASYIYMAFANQF